MDLRLDKDTKYDSVKDLKSCCFFSHLQLLFMFCFSISNVSAKFMTATPSWLAKVVVPYVLHLGADIAVVEKDLQVLLATRNGTGHIMIRNYAYVYIQSQCVMLCYIMPDQITLHHIDHTASLGNRAQDISS